MSVHKISGYGWRLFPYRLEDGVYEFEVEDAAESGSDLDLVLRIDGGPLDGHRVQCQLPDRGLLEVGPGSPSTADLERLSLTGTRFSAQVTAGLRIGFGIIPATVRVSTP